MSERPFICGTDMPLLRAQMRIDYLEKKLEIYAKPVEMTREQAQPFILRKNVGKTFRNTVYEIEYNGRISQIKIKKLYADINEEDLIRAWDNPNQVIKVVE